MRRRGYFKCPKLDKALPNLALPKATIWLRYLENIMFMNYPAPKNIDPAGGQPSSVSPFHFPATKAALAPLHLPQIPPPFSYLSAALVVLSAAFFQYSLTPGSALAPFVFFFPGVCAVTFFGGFLPGVLAVVLSALIGNFLFPAILQ